MTYVTVHVSAELLQQLGDWSEPVQVQITETPGVGTGWDMIARTVDVAAAEARGRKQAADAIAEQIKRWAMGIGEETGYWDDAQVGLDAAAIARAYGAEQETSGGGDG